NAGGRLLAASFLSAPASLVIAKMIVPETECSETAGGAVIKREGRAVNLADALCSGASEGFRMAMNIMAMLIAFVATLYIVNVALSGAGARIGVHNLTLEKI